ncbi:MAG: gamma-glutamyl-gamma-aminobutyrate hydrolase family protein [Erysipelotrichaceae bacterium]|nr:gamma-glutamyl-gamma-aminobutyrate hydrolase family protein [Erysipelotrichaceae bacterium]
MKLLIPVLEMSPVNYVNAVKGCGGEADVTNRLCEIDEYDGLLLPGGADMDPSYYHEENKGSRDINKPLDELRLSFFRKFYEADKPILGICRGFQLINVALGGSLQQDIHTGIDHNYFGQNRDAVHKATAKEGSFLYDLYGENLSINSSHHQAIGRLAEGLEVLARADDGIIEAVCSKEKKIYAVQFHPERMCFEHKREDTIDGSKIFRFFLQICENNR